MKRVIYLFVMLGALNIKCPLKQITISGYVLDSKNVGMVGTKINFTGHEAITRADSTGFYKKALPRRWIGTVSPAQENFNFLPSYRSYDNLQADLVNQNFIGYTADDLPAAPTRLGAIMPFFDVAYLGWKDNADNETGFIIRRTLPEDTTTFIEIGRVPTDTTKFIAVGLRPGTRYFFRVAAYNRFGESEPAQTSPRLYGILSRPTELQAVPRFNSILLTWKDNNEEEDGFVIERDNKKIADVSDLPANTRFFLDNGLSPEQSYSYVVYASKNARLSDPSIRVFASPLSTSPIVEHSNGLEIDYAGGGAGGWSKFKISGYDQLYDGHLQLWIGGNVVHDGDDGDFTCATSMVLNPPTGDIDYEYTSARPGSRDPVILRCADEDIEVHQFTYKKRDKNWILIAWTVYNTGDMPRNVKLALFLDADAGGDFSVRDYGGFDKQKSLVYINNEDDNMYVGMAIVSDKSLFDNYQICHFFDPRTPDNSNVNHNGERARMELLRGSEFYTGNLWNPDDDPADLTMTLISNLGTISSNSSKRIFYVLSVATTLTVLQNSVEEAKIFSQSIVVERE